MRLEQNYIPDFNYCIVCGAETPSDTCSKTCASKLTLLRFAIKERKEIEVEGLKLYDEHSIKKFRDVQESLSAKE